MFLWILVVFLLTAILLRVRAILPGRRRTPSFTSRHGPCKTCIVLGSGGHTMEMLRLVQTLGEQYQPRVYIVADALSAKALQRQSEPNEVIPIARARHVGQSWSSVPFTAARALLDAIRVVWKIMPDLILCNGPGTCVPICLAAYIPRFLGIRNIQIVYIESFARIHALSLTGRLLYHFVDRLLVQWPDLQDTKAEYHGVLV
ncbi:UDP-N-acetylglucosamine transferase subunit ALG14 [Syncephalastrum racemosum]|uniref:UDP-N-acetylglucosamine transferase subunit ALG14 n=1 Tax=Syncephalastrum racemosum TaxID=13706 RepID=A0A1X2HE65_SYNRA|nr:UDP-N-acetylglucosamine transferase subunit ALG14 [Syncephalastrum racemosum]